LPTIKKIIEGNPPKLYAKVDTIASKVRTRVTQSIFKIFNYSSLMLEQRRKEFDLKNESS